LLTCKLEGILTYFQGKVNTKLVDSRWSLVAGWLSPARPGEFSRTSLVSGNTAQVAVFRRSKTPKIENYQY